MDDTYLNILVNSLGTYYILCFFSIVNGNKFGKYRVKSKDSVVNLAGVIVQIVYVLISGQPLPEGLNLPVLGSIVCP